MIVNGDVQLLINTPLGKHAQRDDYTLRQAAIAHRVAYTTTLSAASAACDAILVAALARASRCGRCRSGTQRHPDARRSTCERASATAVRARVGLRRRRRDDRRGHEGLALLPRHAAAR